MAETKNEVPVEGATTAALDASGAADIAPATEFSPSGAPRQVTDIPIDHPAVDNNPRANTTVDMNRIDMNDPTISGDDAVATTLGMKTAEEAQKEAEAAAAAEAKSKVKG